MPTRLLNLLQNLCSKESNLNAAGIIDFLGKKDADMPTVFLCASFPTDN